MRIFRPLFVILVLLVFGHPAYSDENDARNFLIVATGSVPALGDVRIKLVDRQLTAIDGNCSSTGSSGAHDMLGKAHSLLQVNQPLLKLLSDFVLVSAAQCRKFEGTALISLYVLERNAGASHESTIAKLIKNPSPLVAKWSNR